MPPPHGPPPHGPPPYGPPPPHGPPPGGCGYGGYGPSPQEIDDLARRVINGEFGNGNERRAKLGSAYDMVPNRVNEMMGSSKRHGW